MSTATIPLAARERIDTSIIKGGLAVGVMDLVLAFGWYVVILGATTPMRVLQSIAAGVLGKESYQGGAATAVLGGVLHFVIAFIWAGIFYLVLQRSSLLQRLLANQLSAVLVGLAYGVVMWAGMRYIVLPLSAAGGGTGQFNWNTVAMVVGHAVMLGIPLALIMRQGMRNRAWQEAPGDWSPRKGSLP